MGDRKVIAGGELFVLFGNKTIPMINKENWLKWFIITIPALIVIYIVSYALQWVLWKWIWLAIPIWIFLYYATRKYGTNYNMSTLHKTDKYIDRDNFKKWSEQSPRGKDVIIPEPMPIIPATFWEKLKYRVRRYLP